LIALCEQQERMAQYKASMERWVGQQEEEKEDPTPFLLPRGDPPPRTTNKHTTTLEEEESSSLLLAWFEQHAKVLMMPVLPLLWCLLCVTTLNREMVLSAYAMPLLGIASASLANSVPVGGGIVFLPILNLVADIDLHLGVSFAVATMTFGNGVFGFLTWLQKDPKSIAWHVVPYAVLPAWIGATLGTFYPFLTPFQCRQLFALFCLKVALIVARGIYIGKRNNSETAFSIAVASDIHVDVERKNDDILQKLSASACSFLAGSILVSHIGIGNAITTFLVGCFVWRLNAKSAVVTAILCGGWTSLVPFLLHLFVLQDVPIALWVMGLPGVYLGARIAPLVHEQLGIATVLLAFCFFLIFTFLLMIS
jgi:uncharacterized membrane protein YfcA